MPSIWLTKMSKGFTDTLKNPQTFCGFLWNSFFSSLFQYSLVPFFLINRKEYKEYKDFEGHKEKRSSGPSERIHPIKQTTLFFVLFSVFVLFVLFAVFAVLVVFVVFVVFVLFVILVILVILPTNPPTKAMQISPQNSVAETLLFLMLDAES